MNYIATDLSPMPCQFASIIVIIMVLANYSMQYHRTNLVTHTLKMFSNMRPILGQKTAFLYGILEYYLTEINSYLPICPQHSSVTFLAQNVWAWDITSWGWDQPWWGQPGDLQLFNLTDVFERGYSRPYEHKKNYFLYLKKELKQSTVPFHLQSKVSGGLPHVLGLHWLF